MKKILIVPNPYLENKEDIIKRINEILFNNKISVFDLSLNNEKNYEELSKTLKDTDAIITLGGDGSLLRVAQDAAKMNVPLLGINYGGTGYLTSLKKNELEPLKKLINNEYYIENRFMLKIKLNDNYEHLVLNDVIIAKKDIDVPIKLKVNEEEIYYGDGLIISTPTGSSAYNYSAGGPLLDAKSRQIVLTPICPVGRKNSYKIYDDKTVLNISSIRDNRDEALVCIDGLKPILINNKSTVTISASKYETKLIRF